MRQLRAGLALVVLIGGCAEAVEANRAPRAFAGFDQMVAPGEQAVLDGSGSWDPDQDALSYRWRLESQPAASDLELMSDVANGPRLRFVPLDAGRYVLRLTVEDGRAASALDMVNVYAFDPGSAPAVTMPRARAPRNGWALLGDAVPLTAEVLDLDPENAPHFSWQWILRPALSRLGGGDLADADRATCSFTPDVVGDYVLSVQVSDGRQVGPPDFVGVRVFAGSPQPEPPLADAGTSAVIARNVETWLDAGDSLGSDGGGQSIEAFRWEVALLPSGAPAPFIEVTEERHSVQLSREGLYLFRLEVSSGGLASAPDLVAVRVWPGSS